MPAAKRLPRTKPSNKALQQTAAVVSGFWDFKLIAAAAAELYRYAFELKKVPGTIE